MGFLDFLTGKTNCPKCGTPGAKREGNQLRCLNPTCEWFDQGLLREAFGGPGLPAGAGQPASPPPGVPERDMARPTRLPASAASAPPGPTITIRYRNFRGQDLTFTADASSARQKKNHISIKAVPTGQRVTPARARIQNWREFGDSLSQRVAPGQEWPTPRERQVLGYHKKHGTTSPALRANPRQVPRLVEEEIGTRGFGFEPSHTLQEGRSTCPDASQSACTTRAADYGLTLVTFRPFGVSKRAGSTESTFSSRVTAPILTSLRLPSGS